MTQTREDWLAQALAEARPVVEALCGSALAAQIRVGVGFPSTFKRSGTLVECFPATSSGDAHAEVIVSPTVADPGEVYGYLLAGILHTLPGAMQRASVTFTSAAKAAGIESDDGFKTLRFGPQYFQQWEQIIDSLGPYPHAELSVADKKTQSTRMIKLVCPQCGYILRTTGKWIATGLPRCHDGAEFTVEGE